MDVRIKHTFSVRNLTAVASEHCIRLQVHELPYLSDTNCSRVLSVILRGHGTLEPEKIEEINNDAVSECGTRTFRIQTDEIPAGSRIEVEIVAQSTKCEVGFAFCRCSAPTSQLTVTARFPPEIDPGSVGADTAHRTPCKPILLGREENEFTWVIAGAVLPSQGIQFWWACDLNKMPEIKVNNDR